MSHSISENFKELSDAAQNYIEATIAYQKLDLYKKVMLAAVSTVHKVLVGFMALLGFIFLSFGFAIYLGELLDSTYLGYLIMGLFYVLLCIVVLLTLKPRLEKILLQKSSGKWFSEFKESKTSQYEEDL